MMINVMKLHRKLKSADTLNCMNYNIPDQLHLFAVAFLLKSFKSIRQHVEIYLPV